MTFLPPTAPMVVTIVRASHVQRHHRDCCGHEAWGDGILALRLRVADLIDAWHRANRALGYPADRHDAKHRSAA